MQRTSQTAACNRNHHIGERLAFWLLTCHDSSDNNNLKLTQDFIGEMLGTRRAGVSEAAMTLQSLGLIKCSHGDIHILDRPGLEEFSCECDGAVCQEFERLLGPMKSPPQFNLKTKNTVLAMYCVALRRTEFGRIFLFHVE